jgi:excinuclease UvrABC nuclease subunit
MSWRRRLARFLMDWDRPSYVYWIYDRRKRLIYVGVAYHVRARINQHRNSQPWASEISQVWAKKYRSRAKALRMETHFIRTERPKYNIAKVMTRRRPRAAC